MTCIHQSKEVLHQVVQNREISKRTKSMPSTDALMPGELPVRNLGKPKFPNVQKMGTMACTWHTPIVLWFSCGFAEWPGN